MKNLVSFFRTQPKPSRSEALRRWRREYSLRLKLPAYVVLHNKTLEAIAKHNPKTLDELEQISGIGKKKRELLGKEILKILRAS